MPELYTDESGKDWSLNDLVAENKRLDGVIQELVGKNLKLKVERERFVEALKPLCDEREAAPFSLNQIADILRTSRVHRELGVAKILDQHSERARSALKAVGEEV